ncbi:hypothetical protein GC176_13250 [bacterium]|nr:hypothetical protein [bacterium]
MAGSLRRLWQLLRRSGLRAVIRLLIDRAGKALYGRQVMELLWLESSRVKLSLEHDPKFEFRQLDTHEVAAYARDPANDLDAQMIDRAAGGRDLCFAWLCNGRLASYGWYAFDGIEAEHNAGVALSYPSTVACMYKGFTHPDFRGARLHPIGMGLALQRLRRFGVTSLISTVDWTNERSLKSCDRLGYERLGRFVTTGGNAFRLQRFPQTAVERGVQVGAGAAPGTRHRNRLSREAVDQLAEPVTV